jgi:hypothetical protein
MYEADDVPNPVDPLPITVNTPVVVQLSIRRSWFVLASAVSAVPPSNLEPIILTEGIAPPGAVLPMFPDRVSGMFAASEYPLISKPPSEPDACINAPNAFLG